MSSKCLPCFFFTRNKVGLRLVSRAFGICQSGVVVLMRLRYSSEKDVEVGSREEEEEDEKRVVKRNNKKNAAWASMGEVGKLDSITIQPWARHWKEEACMLPRRHW